MKMKRMEGWNVGRQDVKKEYEDVAKTERKEEK